MDGISIFLRDFHFRPLVCTSAELVELETITTPAQVWWTRPVPPEDSIVLRNPYKVYRTVANLGHDEPAEDIADLTGALGDFSVTEVMDRDGIRYFRFLSDSVPTVYVPVSSTLSLCYSVSFF